MAVHPEVPGLTVSVDVDGQDLPEYEDEDAQDAQPEVVIKYVEAISGAEFKTSLRFDAQEFQHSEQTIVISVSCDGEFMCQKYFTPKHMASTRRQVMGHWVGMGRDGQQIKKAMMFSDLAISENQVNKNLLGKLESLGTITITCSKGRLSLRQSRTGRPSLKKGALVEGPLSEKNLKGQSITHHTTYGPEIPNPYSTYTAHKIGEPFATFKFKYRSRA
ncbi:hypothetical protein KC345_g1316 [Hortaea werneckii]|nr:hypothetical protein KC345_g1316 [Hortaea werneckii]